MKPQPMFTKCHLEYNYDKDYEFCSCYTYYENGDITTFELNKGSCD